MEKITKWEIQNPLSEKHSECQPPVLGENIIT